MSHVALCLLSLLVCVSSAHAQESITVCPKGCDFADIQSAIDSIPSEGVGEIVVGAGSYEGGLLIDRRTVEIRSAGEGDVILDAQSIDRVLHVVDGAQVSLIELTLERGLASGSGGGIRAESGTTLSMLSCIVRDCVSGGDGGGVSVAANAVSSFIDCTFAANNAEGKTSNGGGVHLGWIDGNTIDRCIFQSNFATREGGALFQARGPQTPVTEALAQIRNSAFILNSSGGAIVWMEPALGECGNPIGLGYMTNCTFFQNQPEEGVCIAGIDPDWCGDPGLAADLRIRVFNTIIYQSGESHPGFELEDYRYCYVDFLTQTESDSIQGVSRSPLFMFETKGRQDSYFDPRVLPQSGTIDAGGLALPGAQSIDPGSLDLLGQPRILDDPDSADAQGVQIDIGATEYDVAILDGVPEIPALAFAIWNGAGDGISFTDPLNWSASKLPDAGRLWFGDYGVGTSIELPPVGEDGASIEVGSFGVFEGRLNLVNPPAETGVVRIPDNPDLPFVSGLYVGVGGPATLALDDGMRIECEYLRSLRGRLLLQGGIVRVNTRVELEAQQEDTPGPDGLRVGTLHGPGVVERSGDPAAGEGFDPVLVNRGRIRLDELLTVRGDYEQDGGELKFRSRAGDDTGNLDRRLVVEGQARMGGTVVFDVGAGGWQPTVGSCFEIVNATEGFLPGEDAFDYVVTRWTGDDQNRFFVISNSPCGKLGPGEGESIYATVVSLDDLLSRNESLQSAGVSLEDLLLVDVDADGFDDLVLSIDVGSSAGQVVVLLNQGVTGVGWQGFQEYAGGVVGVTVGVGPRGLDAGYFDAGSSAGGNLDLVVANEGDGTVSVIANDGAVPGGLSLSILQTIDLVNGPEGDGSNPFPVDVCAKNYDLDACGLTDLAITCIDNSIWTLQNTVDCGGAGFTGDPLGNTIRVDRANPRPITSFIPGLGGGTGGGKRTDPPNGSSEDDDSVNEGTVTLPVSGAGFTFVWTRYPIVGGGRPVDLARADVDGDGIEDVVTVNFEDDSFAILPGIVSGGFEGAILVELEEGFVEPSSIALGDLDGDTDVDIAFVCRRVATDERVVRVVRNTLAETGLEGWVFEGDVLLAGQEPYRLRSADVDHDEIDDLVALTELGGLVGGFASGIGTVGPVIEASCFGDINQDGIVDGGDIALVLSDWGPCSGSCPTDFDGNGLVNGGDLAQVLAVWGPCSPGQ